ncbi:MAG TPA: amino acid carrier protein [Candidatus Gastranaerophilaceae bacterium]|nr:amino acid carrier protein [Candidatus Gastranaerophilaceae bacterium]HPT41025.1 amino acid carrier protein [Candidatus Gastranaerophilaceae bacterium]
MKKLFLTLAAFFCSLQSVFAFNLDKEIDKYVTPVSEKVSGIMFFPVTLFGVEIPVIILWILIAGLFFTFYFRWIGIWGLKHSFEILSKPKEGNAEGEISPLGALMSALSGTVGLGTIAGVAISISIGGPGAALWIMFGAVLGMTLKFAEVSLSLKYRKFLPDGTVAGGPMHFIAHGLTRRKMRWLGQPLAVIFAWLCIGGALTGGNMIQINQTTRQIINIAGGETGILHGYNWLIGLICAILMGMIIIGGVKAITKVAMKAVPFMIYLYLFAGIIILIANWHNLPYTFYIMVKEAFFPSSVAGGIIGIMIIGMRRSVQTNEAGTGSAPIVYAPAQTDEPISQGFIALIEPFLTGLVCLLSAGIIVSSGVYKNYTTGVTGIELTSSAFESIFPWFKYILSVVVILFALTTLISWAYYGQKAWNYIVGEGKKRTLFYQLGFLMFTVLGAIMNVNTVINLTDSMMLGMAVPNCLAMYIMAKELKDDLKTYCKKYNVGTKFNKNWFKKA